MKQIISLFLAFAMLTAPAAGLRNGSMITHLASSLAPGDHTLVITPYNLGEESGGNMIIYAFLTNDSSGRSIKGDK